MIQVTGHRGARHLAPENTLAGFRLAHELGCNGVEMDVQLTKDGRLAVIHDDTIDATTDGTGPVADYTLEELKSFDAGNGERMPSLEEVIELLKPTGMYLQIELKGAGTEAVAPGIVDAAGITHRVRFTSSYHLRVLEAKRLLPDVETGILMSSNPVDPLHILEDSKADCLHVKQNRLDQRLVDAVHGGGRKLIAMGAIVEPPIIDSVIELGVDVIGSDRPDLVIERLRSYDLYDAP